MEPRTSHAEMGLRGHIPRNVFSGRHIKQRWVSVVKFVLKNLDLFSKKGQKTGNSVEM
jgi:hypothetical protein